MAFLNRADILKTRPRKTKTVSVPAWCGEVIIQELTARERDHFDQLAESKLETGEFRSLLVSFAVVDEQGNRVFQEQDIEPLADLDATSVDLLFTEIRELSGMTTKAKEDAKNV